MLQIILFTLIVCLLISTIVLFIALQKQKRQTTPLNASSLEDVFQSITLPLLYKKDNRIAYNKAFSKAFGSFFKETIEAIGLLAKNGEHPLLLTFDNNIQKQTIVYTSTLLDSNNNIAGFTALIVDITTLTKSKELLLTQKERLELALESTNEALWDWEIKTDKIFYAPKWKQIMGYAPDEKVSTLASWLNLVHSKDMAHVNEALKAHLDGRSELFEVEHRIRQSEPIRWVCVQGKVLRGKNNEAIRMVGTLREITQDKAQKAEEQKKCDLFISFVDHLPALAFVKDTHGTYLYMNHAYQKYIGFKTWHTKTASELFDAQTADAVAEIDRQALYEGKRKHEITLPTEDGLMSHFDVYTFILDEEDEKILCGFSINKSFK